MSSRQSYEYDVGRAAALRAAAEIQRRRAEAARLRTERAVAIHAQGLALAREHERLQSAQLGSQAQALAGHQAALSALSQRAQAAGFALNTLADQVRASGRELEQARTELHAQMDQLAGLEKGACLQEAALAATLAEARETLSRVEGLQSASTETLIALVDAVSAGRAFSAAQSNLEERIRQLEAEVAFVSHRADLVPVAMVTLQAMESNGYRLQSALGREEMTVYFAKEDAAHQIAVRMMPAGKPAGEVERWDLLAETFGMKGETCLEELDDFETAVEEKGIGRLRRRQERVYPRDDSQAVLPKPPQRPGWKKIRQEDSRVKGRT